MKLETPRLVLREYMSRDWYAVLDYQSDGRYLRFCPWAKRTPAAARAFVDQFTGWARQSPRYRYQLAVTLGQGGTLIGSCGIRKAAADDQEAELGYEIAPDHWGHGYATEAAVAMVGWAFGALGLHRIIAHCLAENRASARVLKKVGMTLEGRLREHRWIKGRWHDTLLYAILDREWRPLTAEQAHNRADGGAMTAREATGT